MSGGFTVASAKPSFLLVNRHMRLCLVTAGNCASRSATQSEIVHAIGALRLRLVWNIETQNRRHKNERAAQTRSGDHLPASDLAGVRVSGWPRAVWRRSAFWGLPPVWPSMTPARLQRCPSPPVWAPMSSSADRTAPWRCSRCRCTDWTRHSGRRWILGPASFVVRRANGTPIVACHPCSLSQENLFMGQSLGENGGN